VNRFRKLITVDIRKIDDSGIGTYIKNLLPKVISMTISDIDYSLIVKRGECNDLAGKYPWINSPNISIIESKSHPLSIAEQFELPQIIPANTVLYWATQFNVPVFLRKKLLVTIHDIIHLAQPNLTGGIKNSLYLKAILTAIHIKQANVLTVSNFTKSEILKYSSIAPDKINVTYAGVADQWYNVKKIQSQYEKPYILFVGNVKKNKNLHNLLSAFKSIVQKIPHDLLIVGAQEKMRSIDRDIIAEAEKVSDRVKFTGYVSEEALEQYFAHASVLVLPSFYEGFGLPPVEAFACGCPVIVSNVSALPEIGQDAALYCDPFSASDIAAKIVTLLTDEILQLKLIKNGKQRASELTYQMAAERTVKVINNIISPISE
jgi:glycosyltransferase involved in cell wall biosynthesis